MPYNHDLLLRSNQIHQWNPSDSAENWTDLNNGIPNYLKNEITYKFNSCGFRSDEFQDDAAVPILFLGCSYTEGIGLPVEHTWPYMIIDKIRSIPGNENKKIPLFSLALGGSGIDTESRFLYEFIDRIKPKYIFYLLSSGYRREICHESFHRPILWAPHRSDQHKDRFGADYSRMLIDDSYAKHQTYRGLMLIDSVARNYEAKIYVLPAFQEKFQTEIFYKFPKIRFQENVDLTRKNSDQFSKTLLETIKNTPYYARDNYHLGAWWQYNVADEMWKLISNAFL